MLLLLYWCVCVYVYKTNCLLQSQKWEKQQNAAYRNGIKLYPERQTREREASRGMTWGEWGGGNTNCTKLRWTNRKIRCLHVNCIAGGLHIHICMYWYIHTLYIYITNWSFFLVFFLHIAADFDDGSFFKYFRFLWPSHVLFFV